MACLLRGSRWAYAPPFSLTQWHAALYLYKCFGVTSDLGMKGDDQTIAMIGHTLLQNPGLKQLGIWSLWNLLSPSHHDIHLIDIRYRMQTQR
jgi:hypothetical protein